VIVTHFTVMSQFQVLLVARTIIMKGAL